VGGAQPLGGGGCVMGKKNQGGMEQGIHPNYGPLTRAEDLTLWLRGTTY